MVASSLAQRATGVNKAATLPSCHIPDWRTALAEVCRVLKPGGRFYAEEVLRDLIDPRLCRALFKHPWEDRFDHGVFIEGLAQAGFRILRTRQWRNRVGWYIAEKKFT